MNENTPPPTNNKQSANTHHTIIRIINAGYLFVCWFWLIVWMYSWGITMIMMMMMMMMGRKNKKNERYSTTTTAKQNKKHKVCMVCDMLPPQTSHIYTHNICSFIKFYSHNDDNINNISNRIYWILFHCI